MHKYPMITLEDAEVTIVLVEDNPGHALILEKCLTRWQIGNQLVKFENGGSALDFIFASGDDKSPPHQPFLILLDLRLPDGSGIDVLRCLKKAVLTKNYPVIILSSSSDPRDKNDCIDSGCNAFVTKPVDYSGLVGALTVSGLSLTA